MELGNCIFAIALAALVLGSAPRADGQLFRYADTVIAADSGSGQFPGFTDPLAMLGAPAGGHSIAAPQNTEAGTGDPLSFSLAQGGGATLGFDLPVLNQAASPQNPYGYDLLVVGNAFQAPTVQLLSGQMGRFQEPGFAEVARADGNGQPLEWFLILPTIYQDPVRGLAVPRDLPPLDFAPPTIGAFGVTLANGDLGASRSLVDGVVDATPFDSAAFASVAAGGDAAALVLDDPATFAVEGIGGTGIDLGRAVRQSGAGVPLLDGGQPVFVSLASIDLIRFTDIHSADVHGEGLGAITPELDAVIVLPDLSNTSGGAPCDFDKNGDCDVADLNGLFTEGDLLAGVSPPADGRHDLDGDHAVTAADLVLWLSEAAAENGFATPYRPGDSELDRDVDISDFNALASHFDPGGANAALNNWSWGNFDGDLDIDITDFNLLVTSFAPGGYDVAGALDAAVPRALVVPEPVGALIIVPGAMAMGLTRRRRYGSRQFGRDA